MLILHTFQALVALSLSAALLRALALRLRVRAD